MAHYNDAYLENRATSLMIKLVDLTIQGLLLVQIQNVTSLTPW